VGKHNQQWTPFMVWKLLARARLHKLVRHSFGRTCGNPECPWLLAGNTPWAADNRGAAE
jgi:hypothetical protein